MNVHQAEVEIFAVVPSVRRFVVILKPIRADVIGDAQKGRKGRAESRRPLLLRGDGGECAVVVFVAAAVLLRGQVELANQNRLAGQRVKSVQVEPREGAVVPGRVQVAGGRIHVRCAGARHFRVIKRLITVAQEQGAWVVSADDLMDERVVAFRQQAKKLAVSPNAVAAGAQIEHPALIQFLETPSAFGFEILQQLRPVVAVRIAQQPD